MVKKSVNFGSLGKVILIIAVVCVVGVVLVRLADSDRVAKPMPVNGDSLGFSTGETSVDYLQRADHSVAQSADPAFALVTFTSQIEVGLATQIVEPMGRVDAVVLASGQILPVPEPTANETRGDVFDRSIDQKNPDRDLSTPELIDAAVVYGPGAQLREVHANANVFAVEVLPADAAWGRFGIRPLPRAGGKVAF